MILNPRIEDIRRGERKNSRKASKKLLRKLSLEKYNSNNNSVDAEDEQHQ